MNRDEYHLYLYGPGRSPLDTSFEDAASRLETLEKLYFEPDGSFVWSSVGGSEQIFGMLYDAAGELQYVDLRGHGTRGQQSREMFLAVIEAISPGNGSSIAKKSDAADLAVVVLPEGSLQDLQSFVSKRWD